ncbi:MAG: DUF2334 domain-containing protein [Gracilimonas sp.]|nr:DUF2334 domain-containing protein [Gracilimonas sp.]
MFKNIISFSFLMILELNIGLSQAQSLNFVIRVDDILSRNVSITPRSIIPLQDTVEARGGKITWGVMPHRFIEQANEDGQLAEELTYSVTRGHEISQHGFEHVCQRCGRSSHEMYCTTFNEPFSYQQQLQLIEDGIQLLEEYTGVTPESFIPPGHISDEITWQILHDSNFDVISTTEDESYLFGSLYNLPPNQEFTWALTPDNYERNLSDALADVIQTADSSEVYTLFLHDPFIREGYQNGITLRWMGEFMDSLKTHFGDFITFTTLSEAAQSVQGDPVSIDHSPHPVAFSLSQNYPNPFNPQTSIPFILNEPSKVKLSVYSMQGKKLKEIENAFLPAGSHTYSFDASELASGIYFYRLTINDRSHTKTMTILK